MNCNTQNAKIASITEKTLIVGIDVGSETHYARAFDWRKPFAFEDELKEKNDRLNALNIELNLDEKDTPVMDTEPEQTEEQPEKKAQDRER